MNVRDAVYLDGLADRPGHTHRLAGRIRSERAGVVRDFIDQGPESPTDQRLVPLDQQECFEWVDFQSN